MDATEAKLETAQNEIDVKITESDKSISNQIAERMAEFTERFSRAQGERSEEFQELQNSISKTQSDAVLQVEKMERLNAEQLQASNQKLEAEINGFQSKASEIVQNLQGIYDAAGQTALAADFAGNAETERKQYTLFSWIASVSFVAAAIALGVLWYALAQEETFTFSDLFKRLPVSLVFLLPAFYFATVANSHRRSAVKLRSLGLRIKSFGAYLTPAEKEEKIELRAEMVHEFFAEKVEEPMKRSFFERNGEKHVEKAMDLAGKVVDKVTPD